MTTPPRGRRALAAAALALLALPAGYLWFVRESPSQAERRPFALPAQRPWAWGEWLARGRDVGFCTLTTGAVRVPRSDMLRRGHAEHDVAREGEPLPIFAHLVRHPAAGDLLVDAGLDASFAADPFGNLRRPARLVHRAMRSAFLLAPGEDVASQLARRGARPGLAFFTHVHGDHTAGVPALAPSTRLAVGAGEANDVAAYLGYGHFGAGRVLEEIDFAAGFSFGPFERAADLFGDGAVLALATPGHSRGHTSYLVHARSGPVLLTGDATHTAWAFAHGVGPRGPTEGDELRAQASLERLRAFAAEHPEVHVTFGHEDATPRCDLDGLGPGPRAAGDE